MSNTVTLPGQTELVKVTIPAKLAAGQTLNTFSGSFECVKGALSSRPLRRPSRLMHVDPAFAHITNADLLKVAAKHPAPAEWLEGDDDYPF